MKKLLSIFLICVVSLLRAVEVAQFSQNGIEVHIDAMPEKVDVSRDFYVTVTVKSPKDANVAIPDLQDRFQGFKIAEDFSETPFVDENGNTTLVSRWRLVPKPVEKKYRLAPFVVGNFYTKSVVFKSPDELEPVTGEMEISPKKDFPPLSWKMVGWVLLGLVAVSLCIFLVVFLVKKIRLAIHLRKMSPIERAYYELGVLLKKGLPGRGFYKDFYIELTMVVRRYIERRHGVKAPNLTTHEFLTAAQKSSAFSEDVIEKLKKFLESSDLIKFANVKATPEMADDACSNAKEYLDRDNKERRDV